MSDNDRVNATNPATLEGAALDRAVAIAVGVEPGPAYSTDWAVGGPMIDRHQIQLAAPQRNIHRHGGPNSGDGAAGFWTATSWVLRRPDGHRGFGFHESRPLVAAMRLIVECLGR